MDSNKKINWYLLSKYRKILMGMAILFIIFFHYYENLINNNINVNAIVSIFSRGNIGVDIFLLLSGIGLYFSYKKNSNHMVFYKKRMKRILIPYFIVAIPFWLWKDVYLSHNFISFIKDLTFISFFQIGNRQLWYVLLILFLYIIYPYIYSFIYDNKRKPLSNFIFLLLISLLVPFAILYMNKSLYNNIEIAISRIPIFIVGCYLGSNVYTKKDIAKKDIIIAFVFLFALWIIKKYTVNLCYNQLLERYFGSYLSVIVSLFIVYLFNFININIINKIFNFLGEYTFEIYMVHVLLITICNYYGVLGTSLFGYFILIFITFIISFLIKKLCIK